MATKDRPSKEARLLSVDRIALTIEEAAESVGLGQGAFEDHILPHCPKFHAGRRIVIPKRRFEEHIEKPAVEEAEQIEETAVELLARTESSSR